MRAALTASLAITPNVLEQTIAKQREQMADQLSIMRRALDSDDFEQCSVAAGHVSAIAKSLHENLEMQQMQSRATVPDASTPALIAELRDRALKHGDKEAQKALKIPVAKKERASVRG